MGLINLMGPSVQADMGMPTDLYPRQKAPIVTGKPVYQAPEKKGFFEKLGSGAMEYLGDPTNRARLAAAFNTMRLNPDPNIARMAQSQIETQQALDLLGKQGNRTADALEAAAKSEANSTRKAQLIAAAETVRSNPSLAKEAAKLLFQKETFGVTPIEVIGPDGQRRLIQVSSSGAVQDVELPEGFQPKKDVERVDTGTEIIFVDTETNLPLLSVPKQVGAAAEAQAAGTERGKASAKSQEQLPSLQDSARQAKELISSLLGKPIDVDGKMQYLGTKGLQESTGKYLGQLDPETLAGATVLSQEAIDTIPIINQLQGKTFLQAFESLKGGGQITEVEGKKAEQAIGRLSRVQSTEAFVEALLDLYEVIETAEKRALEKAGKPGDENLSIQQQADEILAGGK